MAEERLKLIAGMINSEADDKVHSIVAEAKERAEQMENRAYGLMRTQLIAEFQKKKENEEVRLKT